MRTKRKKKKKTKTKRILRLTRNSWNDSYVYFKFIQIRICELLSNDGRLVLLFFFLYLSHSHCLSLSFSFIRSFVPCVSVLLSPGSSFCSPQLLRCASLVYLLRLLFSCLSSHRHFSLHPCHSAVCTPMVFYCKKNTLKTAPNFWTTCPNALYVKGLAYILFRMLDWCLCVRTVKSFEFRFVEDKQFWMANAMRTIFHGIQKGEYWLPAIQLQFLPSSDTPAIWHEFDEFVMVSLVMKWILNQSISNKTHAHFKILRESIDENSLSSSSSYYFSPSRMLFDFYFASHIYSVHIWLEM